MGKTGINSLKKHTFIIGLGAAVAAGIFFPEVSVLNPGGTIVTGTIIGMFFIIGMTLPSETILKGLNKPKTHLFTQGTIFILNPLLFFCFTYLFRIKLHPEIYLGILALSVLPTTISSSTVFTQSAGGNTVGAMFNAVLSNFFGILISPLLLSLLLDQSGQALPNIALVKIFQSLFLKSLLPLLAGQLVRWKLERVINTRLSFLKHLNNGLILLLVLLSIAESSGSPDFIPGLKHLGFPIILMISIHLILLFMIRSLAIRFKLSREDQICTLFSGSQKTLGFGVPLITAYFAGSTYSLGMILLPILFYHPMELVAAGILKSFILSPAKSPQK